MKKYFRYFFILVITLLIGIYAGYKYFSFVSNKTVSALKQEKRNIRFEINQIDNENNKLEQDIKNTDEKILEKIEKDYPNPIDSAEQKCFFKSQKEYEIRDCMYEATEKRRKNITKYINKLKKSPNKTEYESVKKSQDIWNKQKEIDEDLIREFISSHPGTIHFDFSASEYEELIQNRETFLENIYNIVTNKK